MTRTVRDAAILLGIACGVDPRDPATSASDGRFHTDYTTFLDPAGLKGARLGIVRNIPGFDERVMTLFDQAIDDLKAAGAVIVDPANLPNMDSGSVFQELPTTVLNYEFKANINRYFESLGPNAPVKSLAELIRFNDAHREQEMPFFGQERLVISEATTSLDAPEYRKAVETIQRLTRAEGIDAVMDQHRLDALVAPTAEPGLAHGSHPRRSLRRRRQRRHRGDCRLPGHHGADGAGLRPAGGHLVLRARVERTDAPQDRLRLRAGDANAGSRQRSTTTLG